MCFQLPCDWIRMVFRLDTWKMTPQLERVTASPGDISSSAALLENGSRSAHINTSELQPLCCNTTQYRDCFISGRICH